MQRLATAWLCLLGLLTVSNVALAEDEDYARQGLYVGALGLGAIETFDDSPFSFSNGGGFNIRAGYRVVERVAVEGQFEYVTGFEDVGIDIEAWNLMANFKAYLFTERFQPYALFGWGVMEAEASAGGASIDETDFAIRVGGGIDAYLNENWLLFVESAWVKPTDELKDVSYVTVGAGIQFRF